jgi:hypothetical protein
MFQTQRALFLKVNMSIIMYYLIMNMMRWFPNANADKGLFDLEFPQHKRPALASSYVLYRLFSQGQRLSCGI